MEEKYTSQGVEYVAKVDRNGDAATVDIFKSGIAEPIFNVEAGDESITVNGMQFELPNILYYSFDVDKNILFIVVSSIHEYDEFGGELSAIESADGVTSYNIPCNQTVEQIIEECSGY